MRQRMAEMRAGIMPRVSEIDAADMIRSNIAKRFLFSLAASSVVILTFSGMEIRLDIYAVMIDAGSDSRSIRGRSESAPRPAYIAATAIWTISETRAPSAEIEKTDTWRKSFVHPYIAIPDSTACETDMIKNGEKSVPDTYEVPMAFMMSRMKKSWKGRDRAARMGILASPILKNGIILGMKSSIAEKKRDRAPRYAILS